MAGDRRWLFRALDCAERRLRRTAGLWLGRSSRAALTALLCYAPCAAERPPTLEEWSFPMLDGWAVARHSLDDADVDYQPSGLGDRATGNGRDDSRRQLTSLIGRQSSGSALKQQYVEDVHDSGLDQYFTRPPPDVNRTASPPEEDTVKEILNRWDISPINPNDRNPCSVPGVSCLSGHVIKLDFHDRGLVGSIPSILADLRWLEYLDLSWNKLTGTLPAMLGQLSQLRFLRLQCNRLSGSLPNTFANLTRLTFLHLGMNGLTGEIQTGIFGLRQLLHVDLAYNDFTGTLPQSFFAECKIRTFTVEANNFSGSIPDIPLHSALNTLRLRRNRFIGTIPGGLMLLPGLVWLDLAENGLSGSFPPEVNRGQLHSLEHLITESNMLSGTLPSTLCVKNKLRVLNLGHNRFSGSIPEAWAQCEMLCMVGLFRNYLSGSIPAGLLARREMILFDAHRNYLVGRIPKLEYTASDLQLLDLSSNLLTGSLPPLHGQASLIVLRLRKNQLTGTLPDTLCELTSLTALVLSRNCFIGSIPACVGRLSALEVFTLHNNHITGSLPDNISDPAELKVLTLHQNQLSGTIPASMHTKLSILTLHENSLRGTVPMLAVGPACLDSPSPPDGGRSMLCWYLAYIANIYIPTSKTTEATEGDCMWLRFFLSKADQALVKRACGKLCNRCNESQLRFPRLTLHHNRLSCALPELASSNYSILSTSIMGNHFGNHTTILPMWVSDEERQVFLFASGVHTNQAIKHLFIGLLVPFIMALLAFSSAFPELLFAEPCEEFDHLTVQRIRTHVSVLRQVRLACCIGLCLGIAFYGGANYYDCSTLLWTITSFQLHNSPVCGVAVALLWSAFTFYGFQYVDQIPSRRSAPTRRIVHPRRMAAWTCWMFVVLALNVPTVAWTCSQTLPAHSRLPEWLGGSQMLNIVRLTAPPAMVFIDAVVALPLAGLYSKLTPLREEDLIVMFRTFNSWVCPIFCCIILHENCYGGWKVFWDVCQVGSERWREFYWEISDFRLDVLDPVRDICTPRPRWWMKGRCSRSIVQTLIPLLIAKIALKASVEPGVFLLLWILLARLARPGFYVGEQVRISRESLAKKAAYVPVKHRFEEKWATLIDRKCMVCVPSTKDMRVGVVPVAEDRYVVEQEDIIFLPFSMVEPPRWFPKLKRSLLAAMAQRILHPRRQIATIVNYCELLFVFGAMVPMLMPLLYHAVAMNLVALVKGLQQSGACMEGVLFTLPKWTLLYRILAASIFQCWFALETQMHGKYIVLFTTLTLIVMTGRRRLEGKIRPQRDDTEASADTSSCASGSIELSNFTR